MVIFFAAVLLVVLFGFCSLAVDYGRVQVAKTELHRCADAAARAGAAKLSSGVSAAQDAAVAVAAANLADGQSVTLSSADVEFGTWNENSRSLTVLSGAARANADALRVTVRRTALPLLFGTIVGRGSIDLQASAIVRATAGFQSSFVGVDSFAVKNNLYVASYNSSLNTLPTQSNHSSSGVIASNGSITAKNNEVVGTVILGPSGSHNLTLQQPATRLAEDIDRPTLDFSGKPSSNPNSVSANLVVSGTLTLPPGNYAFTTITMNNNALLTFSGSATLYVDGDVAFTNHGEIRAYNRVPSNLKILQRGAGTTFGGSNAKMEVFADIEAPDTAMVAKNDVTFYGRAIFKSIDAKNNAEFYLDEAIGAYYDDLGDAGPIQMVD